MILATVLFIIGLVALSLLLSLARKHTSPSNLERLATDLRPVDVDAFLNLTDEGEEQYLRDHLPAREFRKIQRERKLAAIEYVWAAGQNASILIRLAEAARGDAESEISAAGHKLLDSALRLRLYAFLTIPRLYLGILVPQAHVKRQPLADAYSSMTRQVVMLGCLRFPTHDVSSAL